jgi:hypothetical protein
MKRDAVRPGYERIDHDRLTSALIKPADGYIWDRFFVSDEHPPGTTVEYSILDREDNVLLYPVISGEDISFLGCTPIRIQAELVAGNPAFLTSLHGWSVTWKEIPSELQVS